MGQQTHLYNVLREVRHLSNMDPKALVRSTRHHLVQQRQQVLRSDSSHVQVTQCSHLHFQLSKLMEVCGKQAESLNLFSKVPAKQMSVDSTVW